MAFFEMKYHSDALKTGVSVNVILPENAKTLIGMESKKEQTFKTLYLFHGLSDDHSIWMRRTSIERYAAAYGLAVVMPNVGRSWYTDKVDGTAYLTFVTEELPNVCQGYFRCITGKREDTFVAGLSMGGYGAIKAALTKPERFGGCASLSGALDISEFPANIKEWKGIFGHDLESASELKGSVHDIFDMAKKNSENNIAFPKLYMWCGESDYLIEHNRRFSALLKGLNVPHVYEESEGNHGWNWWDLHIQDALKFLMGN